VVVENVKTSCKDDLSSSGINRFVKSYDVIGDVAVVMIPPSLEQHEKLIGKSLASCDGRIRVVARRCDNYGGEYRKTKLKKIYGEGGLETVHREYGVRLHVDPSAVYFSPRSGSERYRLANCVVEKEDILVLFSGVAPIPLMLSRYSNAESIIGIEKNKVAHFYGIKNLDANTKTDNISLYLGDVREVLPSLQNRFDRLVMPLPSGAIEYLQPALSVLKQKGWLHFYDFQKKGEFMQAAEKVEKVVLRNRRIPLSTAVHKCGHISPFKYRVCVDAQIE